MSTFFTSVQKGTGLRGIELLKEYEGPYDSKGKRHGQGVYRYANHCVYEGNYNHGLKHGRGRITFPDGGSYEGEFLNDEIQGMGIRKFGNGNVFTGQFEKGEMNGLGRMEFANGDLFEGNVKRNVFEGKGTYKRSNGDFYVGDFTGHKMTGRGVMQYASGDKYDGEFVAGQRCGHGACAYVNGDLYVGEWKDGLKDGEGKLVVARSGIAYSGLFVADLPSQIPTKMNGTFVLADGGKVAKAKAPAKGVAEEAPPLQITYGLAATPIKILAELEVPKPAEEEAPLEPPPKGAPPPAPGPIITEAASEGNVWQTAEMESGRIASVSLHVAAPAPLPDGNLVGCTLLTTMLPDESVRVRVRLQTMTLGTSLPLMHHEGEAIHALELTLNGGHHVLEGLTLGGTPEVDEAVSIACAPSGGNGYLVFCSWGILPGFIRLQVPPPPKGGKK